MNNDDKIKEVNDRFKLFQELILATREWSKHQDRYDKAVSEWENSPTPAVTGKAAEQIGEEILELARGSTKIDGRLRNAIAALDNAFKQAGCESKLTGEVNS